MRTFIFTLAVLICLVSHTLIVRDTASSTPAISYQVAMGQVFAGFP